MKRFISIVLLILLICSIFTGIGVVANASEIDIYDAAYVDGYYTYKVLSDGTAEIIHCYAAGSTLDVPSTLGGYTVTKIGEGAFASYKNINLIIIPDTIVSIGKQAFYNCTATWSIEIPNSVEYIGDYAFTYCKNINSIEIPESVIEIGDYAFSGCEDLAEISMPEKEIKLGAEVFIQTAYYNNSENWENDILYIGNHIVDTKSAVPKEYTIKNGTVSVAADAFKYCDNLTKVTIPNSVKAIGQGPFSCNATLTSINVNANNTKYASKNGVLFDKSFATLIQYPAGLRGEYTIPNTVKTIGKEAFWSSFYLSKIVIPSSVNIIEEDAFSWCNGIRNAIILNKNVNIASNAFDGCSNITICGYANSTAYNYAFINDKNFVELKVVGTKSATYFSKGYTGNVVIADSNEIVEKGKNIPALKLKVPTAKINGGKKKFTVNYTKVKGAKGFQVKYKSKGKAVTKTYETKKSVKKVIKKLKKGSYKVQVRTFVKNGNKTAYSNWSSKVKVAVK